MNRIAYCIYAACFCMLVLAPRGASADVIVSEVAWMGTSVSANAEWIELQNTGAESVDLSGWKLEASDGAPKITLSGTVAAGGFFLLERSSDSTVPEEAADQLFTGALGNTGEVLLLTDASGSEVDRVDANPWPAGDNDSKETMQWNGEEWITAEGTPRAANALAGTSPDDPDESDNDSIISSTTPSSTAPSSHSSSESLSAREVTKLVLSKGRDRLAVTHADIEFSTQARDASNSEVSGVDYVWSFGDGKTEKGRETKHAYTYPGTYIVIVNASKGSLEAVTRMSVTIVEPEVRISSASVDFIEIENDSDYEINLQDWQLRSETDDFTFPQDTIILPHTKIKFSKDVTGIGEDAVLLSPDGGKFEEIADVPAENIPAVSTSSPAAVPDTSAPLVLHELMPETQAPPVKVVVSQAVQPIDHSTSPLPEENHAEQVEQTQNENAGTAVSVSAEPLPNADQAAAPGLIYQGEIPKGFLQSIWEGLTGWWK